MLSVRNLENIILKKSNYSSFSFFDIFYGYWLDLSIYNCLPSVTKTPKSVKMAQCWRGLCVQHVQTLKYRVVSVTRVTQFLCSDHTTSAPSFTYFTHMCVFCLAAACSEPSRFVLCVLVHKRVILHRHSMTTPFTLGEGCCAVQMCWFIFFFFWESLTSSFLSESVWSIWVKEEETIFNKRDF